MPAARLSAEGIAFMQETVDSVQAGLYQQLGRLAYTRQDFSKGLHIIKQAVA